jgi:hypothetical protein
MMERTAAVALSLQGMDRLSRSRDDIGSSEFSESVSWESLDGALIIIMELFSKLFYSPLVA